MKILQINSVYGKGSTGKIVLNLHEDYLSEGFQSVVCYGRGHKKGINDSSIYKVTSELESKIQALLSRFFLLQYGGNLLSTCRLISIIKKENPDIVHVHCANGYFINLYTLFNFLAKSKIKTVVTHHAEFFYTGNCGHAFNCDKWKKEKGCGECPILWEATKSYFLDRTSFAWTKMKKCFDSFDVNNLKFTAVSPWVRERSLMSPVVQKFPCAVVFNGLDTSVFKYIPTKASLLEIKRKKVLYVTAHFYPNESDFKGAHFLLDLAKSMPEISFTVVAAYYGEIDNLPENIIFLGSISDSKQLASVYSDSDITLLLSKRETFSMVCAESLSCGTPVVGFKAGGPETIALKKYANFVEYGNLKKLKKEMLDLLSSDVNKSQVSQEAISIYSKKIMATHYIDLYKSFKK